MAEDRDPRWARALKILRGADKCFYFIKKTSYGVGKIYLLHIFRPELHTVMISVF
jgi:hypothetical protein